MGKQESRVLQFMQENGSITSLEAFKELGITRLSARIHTLRHKRGFNILAKSETFKNRFGEPVRYYRYYLPEDEE